MLRDHAWWAWGTLWGVKDQSHVKLLQDKYLPDCVLHGIFDVLISVILLLGDWGACMGQENWSLGDLGPEGQAGSSGDRWDTK